MHQVRRIYLRPPGEQDGNKTLSKIDPFSAFLKACEWAGHTPEKAQEMLREEMAKRKDLASQTHNPNVIQ